ncbi:cupin domain-containing protein [Porticoccaceae bacterium]|jgi:50S ribosomal protein L16 3-hydroxylase|nr:cupin domain-containing protein [Porticoccaceae bacterium]MBT7947193.1 cupin domain-containing protein [Porticoccaceae bacterium]MDC3200449.1 cupin domain-containing protein [Porticoccaceae bacterium]
MKSNHSILGDLTADQFLAEYWQKKPLLIRNAIPNFEPPIDGDDLAGLSLEAEVESRLVIGDDWALEHGPFEESRFASLPEQNWSLLVQGVDLWVPEVADLLSSFDFLPSWRVDDIMVSYAEDGGNVGPHFDYYDVFLIQGEGQRHWQIGQLCSEADLHTDSTALKILKNLEVLDEWTLNPGDMLYLPPKIAHHGVAIGQCTTFSVGFRAPAATEMLDDLATELLSRDITPNHLQDPPLNAAMANEPISGAYIQQVKELLQQTLDDEQMLGEWFAQFMTEPKYPSLVGMTEELRSASLENRPVEGSDTSYNHYLNGQKQD